MDLDLLDRKTEPAKAESNEDLSEGIVAINEKALASVYDDEEVTLPISLLTNEVAGFLEVVYMVALEGDRLGTWEVGVVELFVSSHVGCCIIGISRSHALLLQLPQARTCPSKHAGKQASQVTLQTRFDRATKLIQCLQIVRSHIY